MQAARPYPIAPPDGGPKSPRPLPEGDIFTPALTERHAVLPPCIRDICASRRRATKGHGCPSPDRTPWMVARGCSHGRHGCGLAGITCPENDRAERPSGCAALCSHVVVRKGRACSLCSLPFGIQGYRSPYIWPHPCGTEGTDARAAGNRETDQNGTGEHRLSAGVWSRAGAGQARAVTPLSKA